MADTHFDNDAHAANEERVTQTPGGDPMSTADQTTTSPFFVTLAWLLVGVPLAYGLWQTLVRASALFSG